MSYFDYEDSKKISYHAYSFSACIMAAMREAGSAELKLLRNDFPQIYNELISRRKSPGGILSTDGDAAQLFWQLTNEELDLEGDD